MSLHRILVGIDFSPGSRRALARAVSLAEALGAELVLLNVVGPVHLVTPVARPGLSLAAKAVAAPALARAREELGKYEKGIRRRHVRVRSLAEIGVPADVVVAQAKRLHADLVVVGTAGRTGLSNLLLGSVAERVVRTSTIPVLTVRAPHRRAVARPPSREPRALTLI